MSVTVSASIHLDKGAKLRVRNIEGISGPLISIGSAGGTDANLFFDNVKQLAALHTAITDYLANRFATAVPTATEEAA